MTAPEIRVAFLLDHPSSSSAVETTLSASAIALVSAASRTSTKNRMPRAEPSGMLENTFGIVTNISEGPAFNAFGSPPENANTAGMIMSPARIATAVSKISTCSVAFSMDTSRFMYEPNVIRMPIAMERE